MRIAQSSLVQVPVVIGYARPLILLPVSVVTGLTPSQMEAILAHELGHILRHDWLVNALQIVVETMLFYHPAMWWVSRRLRDTRELCCDDLAIGLVSDRAVLARALLVLEELRQQAAVLMPAPSLAATGGLLRCGSAGCFPSIQRHSPMGETGAAGIMLLAVMGCAGGFTLLAMPSAGERPDETRVVVSEPQPQDDADSKGTNPPTDVASSTDVKNAKGPGEGDAATGDSNEAQPVTPVEGNDAPASEPNGDKPARKGILSLLGLGGDEETSTAQKRVVRVVDEQGIPSKGLKFISSFRRRWGITSRGRPRPMPRARHRRKFQMAPVMST